MSSEYLSTQPDTSFSGRKSCESFGRVQIRDKDTPLPQRSTMRRLSGHLHSQGDR